MNNIFSLDKLAVGAELRVCEVGGRDDMKRRLADLGVVEGTKIRCLMKSPLGDPCAYLIRGAVIAIRRDDAMHIIGECCDCGG
jgi:ferrous iron transport protein A